MARINIEEKWWNDPRRRTLEILLRSQITEQVVVHAWRTGYDFWCKKEGASLIPGSLFIHMHGYKELIQSELAVLYPSTVLIDPINFRTHVEHIPAIVQQDATDPNVIRQCHVYLVGMRDVLLNYIEMRIKKSLAGKASAQKRLLVYGTSQPIPEQNPNTPRTEPEQRRTSLSLSLPLSLTLKKKNIGLSHDSPTHFERIYTKYPKRDGSQRKGDGLKLCQSKFKTDQEVAIFESAVDNYAKYCRETGKIGGEFVLQFYTFVKKMWEEWVPQKANEDRRKQSELAVAQTRAELEAESPSSVSPELAKQAIAKILGTGGPFHSMPKPSF